jgi:hypothetical protein
MNGQGRPLPAAARAVLAGAAVCAALGLAACGSAVAGNGGTKAGPLQGGGGRSAVPNPGGVMVPAPGRAPAKVPLCLHIGSLDRVVITHTPGLMGSGMRETLPAGVTVRNPVAVRALATALCSLPPMPPMLHCPADFGVAYRLWFAAGNQPFPLVTVQTAGCRGVTGLGQARWWGRTPRFWPVMRQALSSGSALLPGKQGGVPTP